MTEYFVPELLRQTSSLAADLPDLLTAAKAGAEEAIAGISGLQRVIVLGSGDSLNAGLSCDPAFAETGNLDYRATSPLEFLYFPPFPSLPPAQVLVAGVSTSGSNPPLVEAIRAARDHGCPTVAITAKADSALAMAARRTILVSTGSQAPSPGIRTYQASLVGLLCLARQLTVRSKYFAGLDDVAAICQVVERSVALGYRAAPMLAGRLATAPVVLVVGLGASLGTARHVAAKVTEGAGLPAAGVVLEDWWHVHRFGHHPRQVVVVMITPGRGRDAALVMARRIAERRPIVVVASEEDSEAMSMDAVPVAAGVPEVVRPLTDHVVAGPLAAELAQLRAVRPFATP